MKLSPLVAPALILMAAPAWAAPPPLEPCGTASYGKSYSFDNSTISFLFDGMVATPAAGVTPAAPAECAISVPAGDPAPQPGGTTVPPGAPGTIKAYSATYKGFVNDGDKATLEVVENGITKTVVVRSTADDDELLHSFLTPDGSGNLASDITLGVESDDPLSFASLDTLDYAFLGTTTVDEQALSLEAMSAQATTVIARLNTTTGLLTNDGAPLERDNEVGLFGAIGSATVGLTAHANLGDGLSVDGGAALFWQPVDSNDLSGVLFAGKATYVTPEDGSAFRWLGSAGINAAPGLGMNFSRTYELGGVEPGDFTTVTANSSGTGLMVGAFVEGGVLVAPAPDNEILFSVSYARNWLDFGDVAEPQTDANPFAYSSGGSSTFDTLKARANWTVGVTPDVDVTLHAAVGHVFASEFSGDVALVGAVNAGGQDETFAEYGAKVDWQFADNAAVGAFVLGSSGTVAGTHVQVGSTVSMKF